MELQLNIIGVLLVLLALVHLVFPRYFNWDKELQLISLANKQLMQVHTFFIALTVFLMGLLLISSSYDIVHTRLGKTIALGLFVFWGIRSVFQFFVYSPKLWKGKLFETIVHIAFSLVWIYFTVVFLLVYLKA